MDFCKFRPNFRGFWGLAGERYNSRAMRKLRKPAFSKRRGGLRAVFTPSFSLKIALLRFSHARDRLSPALLILALATLLALFAFGGDRGYFYRSTVHNANSAKNLSLAENLSPADNFRLFRADVIPKTARGDTPPTAAFRLAGRR